MPQFEKHSKITLLGEEYLIEEVLKSLVKFPADRVVSFFKEIGISFPRELRINILKSVFRDEVFKTRQERHTLADEMNYRLSWFNQFTEVQLVNLFKFYKKVELEEKFLEELWLAILTDLTERPVDEQHLESLIQQSKEFYSKNKKFAHDIINYNRQLDELFFDKKEVIDGLTQDEIRVVLYRSSTITEIRELGKKYGVNVPTRLKKEELIEIICNELKDRNEYTEEIEADLRKMNIILLQRFAKDKDIKASTELKKEEVIEYILANAHETKEIYYIPSPKVYTETIEVPTMPLEEVVVEETKVEEQLVEEKVEPVKEEVVEKVIIKRTETVTDEVFDITSVKPVDVNIVEYHGKKAKKFNPNFILDQEDLEELELEDNEDDVAEKPKKKGGFWKRFLITLLVIIVMLLVLVILYALFTPNGAPEFAKNIEAKLPKFIIDFFEFFRKIGK